MSESKLDAAQLLADVDQEIESLKRSIAQQRALLPVLDQLVRIPLDAINPQKYMRTSGELNALTAQHAMQDAIANLKSTVVPLQRIRGLLQLAVEEQAAEKGVAK